MLKVGHDKPHRRIVMNLTKIELMFVLTDIFQLVKM